MIDFPASPTVGQIFTAGGVTWTWDGSKWTGNGLNVAYLPLIGGTMIGALTLQGNPAGNLDAVPKQYVDVLSAGYPLGDNRIINGDMRIDQRNGGASGTAIGVYTIDRWVYGASQANKGSWQRGGAGGQLTALGFGSFLGFVSSSAYTPLAADQFSFHQRVEADMVSDFCWGTPNAQAVTLSFWASCSLTGTYGGSIRNDSATRSYPFSFSIPVASTWAKIAITIPGDTAGTWVMNGNGEALRVYFDLGAGANFRGTAGAWTGAGDIRGVNGGVNVVATNGAGFNLTGVKLELGSVATPFPRQTMAKSLIDCQRYWQRCNAFFSGNSTTGIQYTAGSLLPVLPRASATLSAINNGANGFPVSGTLSGGGVTGGTVSDSRVCNATTTGGAFTTLIMADAEL